MEENNSVYSNGERKVLVSVKVSTLLLILIIIISLSIVLIKLSNLKKSSKNTQVVQKTVQDIETYESEEESSIVKEPIKITARSSGIRNSELLSIDNSQGQVESSEQEQEGIEPQVEELIEAPEQIETTRIEDVKIAVDMDLTVRTGLSREDFITLISNVKADTSGFFEENAGLIYDLCEKYSLNEIFFCGLISAESGWNIASNHRSTHNYISLMSSNGLIKYGSVEEGLEKAAETLHNKYLEPGGCFYYGKTLSAMKTKFCPASATWVNLVYGRMSQIVK